MRGATGGAADDDTFSTDGESSSDEDMADMIPLSADEIAEFDALSSAAEGSDEVEDDGAFTVGGNSVPEVAGAGDDVDAQNFEPYWPYGNRIINQYSFSYRVACCDETVKERMKIYDWLLTF